MQEDAIIKLGPDHNEKRDFYRMAVNADLTYNIQGETQSYTGKCKDLSHTGLFLETENAITKGQVLEVTIDSNNSQFEPMKATVEVIRVELASDKYSIGCKIIEFK